MGSYFIENDSHTDDSSRFKKPSDIPEQELIEIIQKGFRLKQEGEILYLKIKNIALNMGVLETPNYIKT